MNWNPLCWVFGHRWICGNQPRMCVCGRSFCYAWKVLLLVLALSVPASAQTAARISDSFVAASIIARTVESWQSDDQQHAFGEAGCALGLTLGVTEVLKHTTHRERPDGSDFKSFPSGHTATAMAMGWRLKFGMTFPIGAGAGRVWAKKHHVTDVIGGAAIGAAASVLCQEWIK